MPVNEQHPAILIDFYADWCEPCKWVEPVLEQLKVHFKERLHITKINIDLSPELAQEYHIRSVPTLLLLIDHQEVWRMQGFDSAPVLIRALSPLLPG